MKACAIHAVQEPTRLWCLSLRTRTEKRRTVRGREVGIGLALAQIFVFMGLLGGETSMAI